MAIFLIENTCHFNTSMICELLVNLETSLLTMGMEIFCIIIFSTVILMHLNGLRATNLVLSVQIIVVFIRIYCACELKLAKANKAMNLKELFSIFMKTKLLRCGLKPKTSCCKGSCTTTEAVQLVGFK